MSGYDKNVFINCPYDNGYRRLLRPLLFTILFHGFKPRIALENSDSGKLRLEKIKELINESKFSIHDLSRMQSTNAKEIYRLNMPFELGVDFGYRCIGIEHSEKRFLILEKESHRYMQAISDLNGLDIKFHNNQPQRIVRATRDWFVETINYEDAKSPTVIWGNFIDFNAKLYKDKISKGFTKYEINFMPIPELIKNMKIWLKST